MVQIVFIVIGLALLFKKGPIKLTANRELKDKKKLMAGAGLILIAILMALGIDLKEGWELLGIIPAVVGVVIPLALSTLRETPPLAK